MQQYTSQENSVSPSPYKFSPMTISVIAFQLTCQRDLKITSEKSIIQTTTTGVSRLGVILPGILFA